MRKTALVLLGVLLSGRAVAAEPPAYDLAACIRAALVASPDLAAAAADLAAARARLAEARAGRFGQATYTQILGFANEARGDPTFSPNDKEDYFDDLGPFTRIDLEIDLPVWTFGKLAAALEAAQHGLASERAAGDAKRAAVVLSTKQLYYGLLLSRQLAAVLRDMLDTMDKAVAKTEARLAAGSSAVTETDLLKLKIGRAKFAAGVLEVEASAHLARRALARAIGVAPDAEFDVADRKLQPAAVTLEPLEAYLAAGPERRPEWQRLEQGLAAQAARVDLEAANYYPTVFFSTGVQFADAGNRDEQDNPFAYDDFNYLRPVGVLGLRWDLGFLTTRAKVAQARAELARLEAERQGAASGLRLEIERAYAEAVRARDSLVALEQGRKAGRGLLILNVSNFDLGIGEAADLFEALGAYTQASTDHLRAVHDYNVALGVLSQAVGREVTGLEY